MIQKAAHITWTFLTDSGRDYIDIYTQYIINEYKYIKIERPRFIQHRKTYTFV